MYNRVLLNIVTPYGGVNGCHPKVIAFSSPWHGFKYWLTYSPYPKHNPKYENPVIIASNDLLTWQYPNEITLCNCLDESSKDGVIYNSDPHLVYNQQKDMLEVWWRFVNADHKTVTLFRRCSKDGRSWSPREVMIFSNNWRKYDFISPAILIKHGAYHVYYVHQERIKLLQMREDFHENVFIISKPVVIDISDDAYCPWHIDVIEYQHRTLILYCAYPKKTGWAKRYPMNLYLASSSEQLLRFHKPKCVLRPGPAPGFDCFSLYRSSMLVENDRLILVYSGFGENNDTNLGLHEIAGLKSLLHPDTNTGEQ